MKKQFLLGTVAHNQHQNIAQAVYEGDILAEFHAGGVDVWRSEWTHRLRAFAGRAYPRIDAKLSRRRITTIPETLVSADWRWESYRLAVNHLGLGKLIEDWFWENGEHAPDRYCAEKIPHCEFDGFIGVEHGALRTLANARQHGKPGIVAFLSPHHATRAQWVDSEYERFPELLTSATRIFWTRQGRATRDATKKRESRTLVASGVPSEKIMVVPLGCSDVPAEPANQPRPRIVRFLYSGPVSVRKGAHLLIEVWKQLKPGPSAELHFFGVVTLPKRCIDNPGPGVFFPRLSRDRDPSRKLGEATRPGRTMNDVAAEMLVLYESVTRKHLAGAALGRN